MPALEELDATLTRADLRARVLTALYEGIHRCTVELTALDEIDQSAADVAHLALLASRVADGGAELRAAISSAARRLTPIIRGERAMSAAARAPQYAMRRCIGGHAYLTAAGFPDDAFQAFVNDLVATGAADPPERVPTAAMAARWRYALLGIGDARFDDLLAESVLRKRVHPIYMHPDDVVPLTRSIWYLTDYGRRPPPPSLDVPYLAAVIDAALVWRLPAGDAGGSAELLTAAACLAGVSGRWSPHARWAWRALRTEDSRARPDRYAMRAAAKLACVLLLHPERSQRTADHRADTTASDVAVAALDSALIHAARSHDTVELGRLLVASADEPGQPTLTFVECSAYARRQSPGRRGRRR